LDESPCSGVGRDFPGSSLPSTVFIIITISITLKGTEKVTLKDSEKVT
jgi:hypothetical protein